MCLSLDNILFAPSTFLDELIEVTEELYRSPMLLIAAYQDLPVYSQGPFLVFLSDIKGLDRFIEHRLDPLSRVESEALAKGIIGPLASPRIGTGSI
ncbi:MAG: hypothetical protein ACLFRY_09240 [Spirochaetia bacterium]